MGKRQNVYMPALLWGAERSWNAEEKTPYDGTNRIRFIGYDLSPLSHIHRAPLFPKPAQRTEEYPEHASVMEEKSAAL